MSRNLDPVARVEARAPLVARLNTTLVKSTALRHPDSILATRGGVGDDRRYLVVREDGTRLSGTAKGPLLGIVACEDAGSLRLTFPDGTTVDAPPHVEDGPFEVALFDRVVLARRVRHPAVDRLSAAVGAPVALARVEPPEHAGGHHPLSLLSSATVEDVAHRGGATALDARRFRATIELEGCQAYEEDDWAGRRMRIGDAVVRVTSRIPRCVLTTLDPDTGEPDFPTLEVLAGHRRTGSQLPLGVYGDVEEAGVIRVGDRVVMLPDLGRRAGADTVSPS